MTENYHPPEREDPKFRAYQMLVELQNNPELLSKLIALLKETNPDLFTPQFEAQVRQLFQGTSPSSFNNN